MPNVHSSSFTDRLSRIGYLLKHTFTVIGRDRDILRPWIWMNVYAIVMVSALFFGVLGSFLWADAAGLKLLAMGAVALAFGMFVYKYLFYNYREMSQSWLVYETICGRDRSYAEGKQTAKDRKWGVRKLAGLDVVMAYLMSQRGGGNNGIGQKIVNLIVSGINEVWDLVNHYMLPAIAVDNLTLTDGVKTMKSLRNQVPETLTGVFGIDLAGRIVGQAMISLYLVIGFVAVGAMYLGGEILPSAFQFSYPEHPFGSGPLVLNALPLFVGIYVAKLIGVVFERTITSVKVIYFTIFYTQIAHRDRIAEDLQPELVRYLRMEEPGEAVTSSVQGATATG